MRTNVRLTRGEILCVGVGQKGEAEHGAGAGSGGTFVVRKRSNGEFEALVIAGGAGGDTDGRDGSHRSIYCHAQLWEFGNGPPNMDTQNLELGKAGKSGRPNCFNAGAG